MNRFLKRIVRVEDREIPALLWGFAQIFCIIAGHYVFRPIRDSLGSTRGSLDYKWLYLGTLAATIVTTTAWSALVGRAKAGRLAPIAYQFFAVSFLLFWATFTFFPGSRNELRIGYAFFIWYSVYNLFAVSVFWSRCADLFTHDQGRRMFAFMAGGASLGAITGSAVTAALVKSVGTINLLLLPVALLQLAVFCSHRLAAAAARAREGASSEETRAPEPSSSSPARTSRRALLACIALFVLCSTFCGTFVYTMQSDLASASYPNREDRTGYFARIDLVTNLLAWASETFVTARIIAWIGVGGALMFLPIAYVLGFSIAGAEPVLATVACLEIARRWIGYGVVTPAREILFTVVPRDAKYRAKNLIDTFVWRGGDAAAIWLIEALIVLGALNQAAPAAKTSVIALAGIPIALLWVGLAWRLRRLHREALRSAR